MMAQVPSGLRGRGLRSLALPFRALRRLWRAPAAGRAVAAALVTVTLLGAAFRYWGVLHGFREGYLYHLDARFIVHTAWHHLLGASGLQGRFGAVYGAMMWAALWTADAVTRFLGYPIPWTFEGVSAVASLLGATLGTATVPVVYAVGARAYDRPTGLLAATLFAVSPLHAFQSHYPYRDVPMIFLLGLSLWATIVALQRPGPARFVVAGALAILTAAAKPAGMLAFVPLGVTAALGLYRLRSTRLLAALALSAAAAAALLPVIGSRSVRAAFGFIRRLARLGVVDSAPRHLDTFLFWVGAPFLAATVIAVAYAIWRRRPVDLALGIFLVVAAGSIAYVRFSDERFHLVLLPVACVLIARAAVDGWRAGRGRAWILRPLVGLTAAGLVLAGGGRSAFQGRLLALPDTRAIAGGWFEAHVPRDRRVAIEEYYPLGLNTWPNARGLNTSRSLDAELAGVDAVVTSSVEHERYFESPRRYPRQVEFLTTLPERLPLVKTVALAPLGFLHPDLDVFWARPPGAGRPVRFPVPRPYDHRWNHGVTLLDGGPYDRDDRTVWIGGAQRHLFTMASREPIDEVRAIVLNGPAPSELRLEVGWHRRDVSLAPGEWRTLRFRPGWPWPYRPALYGVTIALRPEGTWALVQLRVGAREIGEGLAAWGDWTGAAAHLERALAANPADVETGLLLAAVHRQAGRTEAAQALVRRLAAATPRVEAYRRLADARLSPVEWAAAFAETTGLDPEWLPEALGQEFEAEDLVLKTGRHLADAGASRHLSVVFDRARDAAGVVVNGPFVFHQPPGAYRVRVRLRGWDAAPGARAVAVLRVYAETRLLAERTLAAGDIGPEYVDVAVPYRHDHPRDRVAFQVEATGAASLAVDRIRVTPDLRETFAAQLAPVLIGVP